MIDYEKEIVEAWEKFQRIISDEEIEADEQGLLPFLFECFRANSVLRSRVVPELQYPIKIKEYREIKKGIQHKPFANGREMDFGFGDTLQSKMLYSKIHRERHLEAVFELKVIYCRESGDGKVGGVNDNQLKETIKLLGLTYANKDTSLQEVPLKNRFLGILFVYPSWARKDHLLASKIEKQLQTKFNKISKLLSDEKLILLQERAGFTADHKNNLAIVAKMSRME